MTFWKCNFYNGNIRFFVIWFMFFPFAFRDYSMWSDVPIWFEVIVCWTTTATELKPFSSKRKLPIRMYNSPIKIHSSSNICNQHMSMHYFTERSPCVNDIILYLTFFFHIWFSMRARSKFTCFSNLLARCDFIIHLIGSFGDYIYFSSLSFSRPFSFSRLQFLLI